MKVITAVIGAVSSQDRPGRGGRAERAAAQKGMHRAISLSSRSHRLNTSTHDSRGS